jgi:hypothetical protein
MIYRGFGNKERDHHACATAAREKTFRDAGIGVDVSATERAAVPELLGSSLRL